MKKSHYLTLLILTALFFIFPLQAEEDSHISIYEVYNKKKGEYKLYVDNTFFIPYFISLSFPGIKNLKVPVDQPYQVAVPPNTKKKHLVTLNPINIRKSYTLSYQYSYAMGDPLTVKHDDDFLYVFPFEHSNKYRVGQAYHGNFSHYDENEYAIDFDMDIGTPIYAARSGIVVRVKEDSDKGGPTDTYAEYTNSIMIYHNDGTFGNYVHLKKNGSLVNVGDKVKQGDMIGYSGNTGVSTGPHLHFDVRVPTTEGKYQSIPFHFLNYDGTAVTAVEGTYYYATHRGMPVYEVKLGNTITNEHYADHRVSIDQTDKLNIRTEKIDDTSVLFFQNGETRKYEVELMFELTNYVSSKKLPLTLIIPPLTEIYALFLRPKDPTQPSGYSLKYTYTPVK